MASAKKTAGKRAKPAWAEDGAHTPLPSINISRVQTASGLRAAIRRVREDKNTPLAITCDGKKKYVMMSRGYFRKMAETARYGMPNRRADVTRQLAAAAKIKISSLPH